MSSDPCQSLRDQIDALNATVDSFQDMLHEAPPGAKPGLIALIRKTQAEIGERKHDLVVCEASNPEPKNVVFTTETCPIYTDEQFRIWQHVVDNQLGVAGSDPWGHWIGDAPAERFGALNVNNWYPLSNEKQTLCGTLHHFNFYDGIGDEADWNNFMIPNPEFAHLLEDPKETYGADDAWHSCAGVHDCMEAEITPDQTYYENLFNSKSRGESSLEGQVVCAYGPWIRERVHSNRPEIHPSELYWWRGRLASAGGDFSYFLMLLQDDSNRFDREDNYDFGWPWEGPPSGWRPWSKSPRTGRFRIAFELDPADRPLTFEIHQLDARRVQSRWDDQDPGKHHALEYNGKVVLEVEERQPVDRNIGVSFGSVRRNAENNRLQGYIVLTCTVGDNDRGGEGYLTLRVDVERPPLVVKDGLVDVEDDWPVLAEPASPAEEQIVLQARPKSLRRAEINGNPRLVGDVEVMLTGRPDPTAIGPNLTVANVDLVGADQRRGLAFEPTRQIPDSVTTRSAVKDLPVATGARFEMTTRSGTVVPLETPPIMLAPRIAAETPQFSGHDPAAWPALVTAVGGQPRSPEPPIPVVRARQWRIEAAPEYAPVREGSAHLEDDSPFTEELNEVIRNVDHARMTEIFGSDRPFNVEWSFQATNLTTGATIPVNVGNGDTATAARVDISPGKNLGEGIEITFPEQPTDSVFELTATARLSDVVGMEGKVEHCVWSHVLSIEDRDQGLQLILPTVATLAGVDPDELMTSSGPGESGLDEINHDPRISNLRTTRAGVVRLLAMSAAEDQRVTVETLRALVRGAKLFGSTR